MTAPVAQLRYLTRATRNSAENVQPDAQPAADQIPRKPLSAAELRAQLRAQPARNQATQTVATVARVVAHQEYPADPPAGVGMEARRQRVVEILAAYPGFKYAVVTDTNADPGVVVVHIGIRDIGSGEIVIVQARYDGLELLKLLEAQAAQAVAAGGPEDHRHGNPA